MLYTFIPAPIICITNILLLCQLRKSKSKANVSRKKNTILWTNISVLSVTTLFIVLSVQNSIIGIFFIQTLYETREGRLIVFISDAFVFSFHGLNFLTLFWSNKQFAKKAKNVVICVYSSTKSEATVKISKSNKPEVKSGF